MWWKENIKPEIISILLLHQMMYCIKLHFNNSTTRTNMSYRKVAARHQLDDNFGNAYCPTLLPVKLTCTAHPTVQISTSFSVAYLVQIIPSFVNHAVTARLVWQRGSGRGLVAFLRFHVVKEQQTRATRPVKMHSSASLLSPSYMPFRSSHQQQR